MTILAVVGLKREARIAEGRDVRVVTSGNNVTALRGKIERALSKEIEGIISFGVAGSLVPELRSGDIVVASSVVSGRECHETDKRWSAQMLDAIPGSICVPVVGSNGVATTAAAKAALHEATKDVAKWVESRKTRWRRMGACTVDMESHIAGLVARERNLPFVVLRTIADVYSSEVPPAAVAAINSNGGISIVALVRSLIVSPSQIPALIRLGHEAEPAFAALLRCSDLLGPRLGFPDLG